MFIPFKPYWYVIGQVIKQQTLLPRDIWKGLILFQIGMFIVEMGPLSKLEKRSLN